jgi:hypothetical protein
VKGMYLDFCDTNLRGSRKNHYKFARGITRARAKRFWGCPPPSTTKTTIRRTGARRATGQLAPTANGWPSDLPTPAWGMVRLTGKSVKSGQSTWADC